MERVYGIDEIQEVIEHALRWTEILTIMVREKGEIYLRKHQFISYNGTIPDDAQRFKVNFEVDNLITKLWAQDFVGNIREDEYDGTHFYFIFIPYKGNREKW